MTGKRGEVEVHEEFIGAVLEQLGDLDKYLVIPLLGIMLPPQFALSRTSKELGRCAKCLASSKDVPMERSLASESGIQFR